VWTDASRWLNNGDMWDAVMNYQFTRACIAFFIGPALDENELRLTSLYPPGPSDVETFRRNIERLIGTYPWSVTSVMLNLLGSHDMARFVTHARGDKSALRLATLFQMTYPGAPSIYYGDEVGMTGGHDPANRGAFPWHRPESWDTNLLHDFQKYIALRKSHPALRRGSFTILYASDGVFAFARQLGDETLVVALNASTGTRRVDIPMQGLLPDGSSLDEVWTRDSSRCDAGALRGVDMTPRSGRVLLSSAPR
jgi:cyclomaltodextrinase / maltogenic alpha-amylase / neopullulanase